MMDWLIYILGIPVLLYINPLLLGIGMFPIAFVVGKITKGALGPWVITPVTFVISLCIWTYIYGYIWMKLSGHNTPILFLLMGLFNSFMTSKGTSEVKANASNKKMGVGEKFAIIAIIISTIINGGEWI